MALNKQLAHNMHTVRELKRKEKKETNTDKVLLDPNYDPHPESKQVNSK